MCKLMETQNETSCPATGFYRSWIRLTLICLSVPPIHGVNDLGDESSQFASIILSPYVGNILNEPEIIDPQLGRSCSQTLTLTSV